MHTFVIFFLTFVLNLVSALTYHGADFSSLLLMESSSSIRYFSIDSTQDQPFERILYDYGVNLARIRIWTAKPYDLTYALELAQRAKAVGMDILINLQYSDQWTDPGTQVIPSGWPTDLEGLVSHIYSYTSDIVQAFNSQGTSIQFIQFGNEVNNGMMFPLGCISVNGFTATSKLLHAGALAVREASPSTKTVIHMANGWDKEDVSYFYGGIFTGGETEEGLGGGLTRSDVDVMGFSFYPFYGTEATFANLASSMDYIVSMYNMSIMIVETDWPAVCSTGAVQLSEPSIPSDAEGQVLWYKGILSVLNNVNQNHGDKAIGLLYFEPGWIWNPVLNSPCSDNLLVTNGGIARSSMSLFSME